MKPGDAGCDAACEKLLASYEKSGREVLYDDTDQRAGAKFATADLIGIPWQVIVGPRGVAEGTVEVKRRATGERDVRKIDDLVATVGAGTLARRPAQPRLPPRRLRRPGGRGPSPASNAWLPGATCARAARRR